VLTVSRRLNLRGALAAVAETRAVGVGEVRRSSSVWSRSRCCSRPPPRWCSPCGSRRWTANRRTLGPLHGPGKLVAAFFTGVQPRTSGFNSLDVSAFREQTLLASDVLMFVGTGSAGTGGGVKVTTAAVLALAVWAEACGDPDVQAFGRRIPQAAVRQALAVTVIAFTAVLVATFALVAVAPYGLARLLFETLSAFGTVGLSTGSPLSSPSRASSCSSR
jgi:cation transport protein